MYLDSTCNKVVLNSFALYGDGSGLDGLNASNLSKGTVPSDRLPTASSTLGGVKTTSTVTSNSGYTACPIISGIPYYKDTDTHYTSHLYVGTSGGTANVTSTTSNPYLLCVDNSTNRNSIQLKAGSNMSISAVNGVVTFTSSYTNTTYSTATTSANGLMSSTDKSTLDSLNSNLGSFKFIQVTVSAGQNYILSNVSSKYNIYITSMCIAILQIGTISNIYTAYNTNSTFNVSKTIANQTSNMATLVVNSSNQLYIANTNTSSAARCIIIYI
jgi:hypothetical protein